MLIAVFFRVIGAALYLEASILLTHRCLAVHPDIQKEWVAECWHTIHEQRMWPVVEFFTETGRVRVTVLPHLFKQECEGTGKVICMRQHVPLIVAHAVTVHKAQGQTLDRVIVDIESTWAFGQLYTALSRAKSVAHMQWKGAVVENSKAFRLASPHVLAFHRSLNWVNVDNSPEAMPV